MLTAIEGYYDKGQIILNEEPPVHTKTGVIVTFLHEGKEAAQQGKRVLGRLEGKIKISDDFDEPLEDLKDYM